MPRNGSGVSTPAVNFTTEAGSAPIEISKLDTALVDLSDEITNSIAADGQTSPTQNLPMNGKRHTNVGAGQALTDYARVGEVVGQGHTFYDTTGTQPDYVITPSPAISSYTEGQRFSIKIHSAFASGSATLNVSEQGAKSIFILDGAGNQRPVPIGALRANGIYEVVYNDTVASFSGGFQLLNFIPVWSVVTTSATSYTIPDKTQWTIFHFTAGTAVAVSLNSGSHTIVGAPIKIVQAGAGQVTIGGTATVEGKGTKTSVQGGIADLTLRASGVWLAEGDLTT